MKNQIRLILFAVFGLVALGLSYWIAGWIADYAFAYADFFEEMESVLFELAAIKFFILVLFTFLSLYRYMPIIMTGALLIANILSYLYIYLIRFPIQEERMLLIVAAVDLVLVHGIGLLLNLLAPNENPKKKVEKEKSEEQLKLMELQEKIALKRKMMEELERNIEQKKLEAENARAEAVQKETTDHVSWPVRIDIGVEDLKSCFDQVRKISTEQEEAQNREDEARKNEQKRGRSLEEREKAVERKEEVIEQTIENLEKISETIKERIRILEERERQIELKGKNRDTDMENENRREIEQQLYEMIFQSPDLLDDEVKLKDDTREVIINKDDLLEIRQMIEANIDAE